VGGIRRCRWIGVQDDLFDLKGDSLNAMMILSRVQELLGVEVPLRKFMSGNATVAVSRLR